MSTRAIPSLPFDRSLVGSLHAFYRPRMLALRTSAQGPAGQVEVELIPIDAPTSGDHPLQQSLRIDLRVDGALIEAMETQLTLVPDPCRTEPRRALQELRERIDALPDQIERVTTTLARDGAWIHDGRIAAAARERVFDGLWDVLLAASLEEEWRPRAPECRVHRPADYLVINCSSSSFTRRPERGMTSAPLVGGHGRDAYLDDALGVTRLVDTGLSSVARFEAPDVFVIEAEEGHPLPGVRSIVVWTEDPYDFRHAQAQFRARTIAPTVAWHRHDQGDVYARALELRRSDHAVAELPSVGAWLVEGLREGRWSDPIRRPPILVEACGWYAFCRLMKSLDPPESIPLEQVERAISTLTTLGATLDATFEHGPPYCDDGPLPAPLEQARAIGEEFGAFVSSLAARTQA